MDQDTARILFAIAGGVLEIVGLTWIVAEAARERREEFGELGPLGRIAGWFRYWLFEQPPKPQSIEIGAASSVSAGGSVTVTSSRETDIERLERLIGELTARLDQHEQRAAAEHQALRVDVAQLDARLSGKLEQAATDSREQRRTALRREIRGARIFMTGAALTIVSSLL